MKDAKNSILVANNLMNCIVLCFIFLQFGCSEKIRMPESVVGDWHYRESDYKLEKNINIDKAIIVFCGTKQAGTFFFRTNAIKGSYFVKENQITLSISNSILFSGKFVDKNKIVGTWRYIGDGFPAVTKGYWECYRVVTCRSPIMDSR